MGFSVTTIDDAVLGVFRREKFVAVYVAGPLSPVARYPGDNRLGRPVRIGHTAALTTDEISRKFDTASAYWPQGVLFRVWVKGKTAAQELEEYLRARYTGFDALRRNWVEMGPDWDHALGELDVRAAAGALGLQCWSDEELVKHLGMIVQDEMKRAAQRMATAGA